MWIASLVHCPREGLDGTRNVFNFTQEMRIVTTEVQTATRCWEIWQAFYTMQEIVSLANLRVIKETLTDPSGRAV
jgi:hypothetical protein